MLKRHFQTGFSLIEILLALLVISVGLLSVSGLLGSSLQSASAAEDDQLAVSFADMVFGYLQATTNWNAVPPTGLTITDYNNQPLELILETPTAFSNTLFSKSGVAYEQKPILYLLRAQTSGRVKTLELKVWPGYSTNAAPPRFFYTEIYQRASVR